MAGRRCPPLAERRGRQDTAGPGGRGKAGRMTAWGLVGVCRSQSLSHCKERSKEVFAWDRALQDYASMCFSSLPLGSSAGSAS